MSSEKKNLVKKNHSFSSILDGIPKFQLPSASKQQSINEEDTNNIFKLNEDSKWNIQKDCSVKKYDI